MQDLIKALNDCYRHELTMVVRYSNYALHSTGIDRMHLNELFEAGAKDSLEHAAKVGLKIFSLGGTPQGKVAEDLGSVPAGNEGMLEQALKDAEASVNLYSETIPLVKKDLALRELLVHILKEEQEEADELRMLVRK